MNQSQSLPLAGTPGTEAPIDITLAAAKRGDATAFASLYDQHAPRVYALCLRMSADVVRAEELVQDVFVRVWQRLGSFRGESAFPTWLHRLTVNVVLQSRRSDRRRNARVTLGEDLAPGIFDAVERTSDPGIRMDLEQAVSGLPEMLRDVFVLHDVQGFPHAEIAEMLEIPVGTCRSHLFRARRTLREVLA